MPWHKSDILRQIYRSLNIEIIKCVFMTKRKRIHKCRRRNYYYIVLKKFGCFQKSRSFKLLCGIFMTKSLTVLGVCLIKSLINEQGFDSTATTLYRKGLAPKLTFCSIILNFLISKARQARRPFELLPKLDYKSFTLNAFE